MRSLGGEKDEETSEVMKDKEKLFSRIFIFTIKLIFCIFILNESVVNMTGKQHEWNGLGMPEKLLTPKSIYNTTNPSQLCKELDCAQKGLRCADPSPACI